MDMYSAIYHIGYAIHV